MSYNRENVVWQSKNGLWNRGFFTTSTCGYDNEDYDSEWDVDYDYDSFEWVSTGHQSMQSAMHSWNGSNPGGLTRIEYKNNPKLCNEYDYMAWAHNHPEEVAKLNEKKHQAEVRKLIAEAQERLVPNYVVAGRDYAVTLTGGSSFTGRLTRKGDWLVTQRGTKTQKVYNVETGRLWCGSQFGSLQGVKSIRRIEPSRW